MTHEFGLFSMPRKPPDPYLPCDFCIDARYLLSEKTRLNQELESFVAQKASLESKIQSFCTDNLGVMEEAAFEEALLALHAELISAQASIDALTVQLSNPAFNILPEIDAYRVFWPTVRGLFPVHVCTVDYDERNGYRTGMFLAIDKLVNIQARKSNKLQQLRNDFDKQKSAAAAELATTTLNSTSKDLVRAASTKATATTTALQKEIDDINAELEALGKQAKQAIHIGSRNAFQKFKLPIIGQKSSPSAMPCMLPRQLPTLLQ